MISFNTSAQPTTGKVTGVLAPTNPLGIGTSAQQTTSSTPRVGVSSPVALGNNQGLISPYTHTTTTNSSGASTSKPTPNKSVLAQQQSLNQANKNTSGYVPLVEDGLAGPKTQAAIEKYGYSTQTGQPNTPKTTTGVMPEKPTTYTPENLGVGGVSQGGLIGNAVQQSQTASPEYVKQQEEANRINQQIEEAKKQMAQQTSDINQSGTWTSRALGEQGQANIQNAATLAALGSQYQGATSQIAAANTAQGLKQSALGTAIGANAPITGVPYGTQTINPATGQPYTTGTSTMNPEASISTYAQQVLNGQMTIDQASTALGNNIGLTTALRNAITQQNPNFNFAQSSTLAGQQGSITPALNYATLALNHAKDTLSKLSIPGQTSNVGAISDVTNWFSNLSGIGKEATRTKEGALAEARSAIQSVLASVKGGNPTEYRDQSYALLPNNATPADIDAAISNLNTLGTGKQNIYSSPGTSTKTSGSTTGGGDTSGANPWH